MASLNKSQLKPKISCLILSCDSQINKGGSVFHCLASVLNQKYDDFEIILIENSHIKIKNIKLLKKFCAKQNNRRTKPVNINIINNKKSISWGAARNKAANLATGEILVFLDDDTIIADSNAFEVVERVAEQNDYGYGASRLWVKNNWFQIKSEEVLNEIISGDFKKVLTHSGEPKAMVRGSHDINLQMKTFIANFGFCKKKVFEKIGGFPDYQGYGFEDDYLMFRLYEGGYKNALLDNLRVVHINHEIKQGTHRSLIPYLQDLIRRNYYWFHVAKMFDKKNWPRDQVLEDLKTIHYDYRLEEAYKKYLQLKPLDIKENEIIKTKSWIDKMRFSKISFARIIALIQSSDNLNTFISTCEADFDNVALVIKIAIDCGFITIDKNSGKINKLFEFNFTRPYTLERVSVENIIPKKQLNQFPCDNDSRLRRVELLKKRYPFAEYLRFGIIGDDDLLSIQFKNDYWAWPVVIEKDLDIINIIKNNDSRVKIYKNDVRYFKNSADVTLQTFITDPPYTLHGALAFIYAGILMLDKDLEEKEFYVIMNETMMGKSLYILQQVLTESNVFLSEVINNFSQYELPDNFSERKRADIFLRNLKISKDALKYSSSSNLYILKTRKPVLKKLRAFINPQLIYEHY